MYWPRSGVSGGKQSAEKGNVAEENLPMEFLVRQPATTSAGLCIASVVLCIDCSAGSIARKTTATKPQQGSTIEIVWLQIHTTKDTKYKVGPKHRYNQMNWSPKVIEVSIIMITMHQLYQMQTGDIRANFYCSTCNIPLCINCFHPWHTKPALYTSVE